jgi:hypothetical protein
MKTSFKFLIVLCTLPLFGNAQTKDSFAFLGNAFDTEWNKGSVRIMGGFSLGSNAVNTRLFNDVLARPTFTESAKTQFLDGTSSRNNIYAETRSVAEYKLTSKWGLAAKFKSLRGFHSAKELSELAILGNSSFQGKQVSSKNLRYIRSSNFVLGATQSLANNEKVQVKLGYGVSFLTSYRSIQAKELSIFTATGGSYIDVVADEAEISEISQGLQGVGLEADLNIEYKWNKKNTLDFLASDFNFTRLLDNEVIVLDSAFRFSGFQLNLLADTNQSIEDFLDSTYSSSIDRSKRRWTSLPSRLQIGWKHKLSCRTMLLVQINAIDLGDLGVTGRAGVSHEFSNKLKMLTTLGYGTFQGIVWNAAAEYRMGKTSLFLNTQSLHALVIPELATNYGVSFGISKQL